jgi:hypothetical protein
MTDYTPSMDELRNAVARFYTQRDDTKPWTANPGPAFDRAIAAHDAAIYEAAWDDGNACPEGYPNPIRQEREESNRG